MDVHLGKKASKVLDPQKNKMLKNLAKKKGNGKHIAELFFFWFRRNSFVISELFAETPLGIDPLKNAENIQGV